jgi:hypothetical protein
MRPTKYPTAKEAAEKNLYSKMRGSEMGFSLREFINLSTQPCHVCGVEPHRALFIKRIKDRYVLHWNYIVCGKPTCGMCRELAKKYGIPQILRLSARIMAKRMHDKRRKEIKIDNCSDIVIPSSGITPIEQK